MTRSDDEKTARLISVCRRLEAATSRLEDMATSIDSSHPETVAAISNANAPAAGPSSADGPDSQAAEPLPRSIEDFDKIINGEVKSFVGASEKVGGLVEQQVCCIVSLRSC